MKTISNKTIAVAVLLLSAIFGIGLSSCSNDDLTNPKEIVKGAWTCESQTGWRTLEFSGDQWTGTYYYPETGTVYVSGKYKWENGDEFIRLTGTTSKGSDFTLVVGYVWGTTQELLIKSSPVEYDRKFLFKRFVL